MVDETTSLLKELDHYKKIFGVDDIATRGYRAIIKVLDQQITMLNDFKLKETISKDKKESVEYDRVQDIFIKMPKMIIELKELRDKLNIEYVEKTERIKATSPQSVGRISN